MVQYHSHLDLDAAIVAAVANGARVEQSEHFLSVFWPHLDGRYTMVLHQSEDPYYASRKVAELQSYEAPLAAVVELEERRSTS